MHTAFQRILLRNSSNGAVGGTFDDIPTTDQLWSVVFAAAGTGDDIVIGAGDSILMDVAQTPIYGNVSIASGGTIVVDRTKDTELRFESMDVSGIYWVGSLDVPYPATLVHKVSPSGARADEVSGNRTSPASAVPSKVRGIMWMAGSEKWWVAEVPATNIVKLAATANAGDTSITLASAVTWKAGWELELSTTKYPSEGVGRERVIVAADVNNSTTVTLTAPLTYRHHGRLQYLVPPAHEDVPNTCLSYTYRAILAGDSFGTVNGNAYTGARVLASIAAGAPTVLDNRCTVGVLTYPIKFAGPNDSDWTTHGYGASDMVMGLSSKHMEQGVERYRVGKAGQLGAYGGTHHHMRSYTPYGQVGSGTLLGAVDATRNFTQYCSVRDSTNRGGSIHGTNGGILKGTVYSNIDTHCIFFEDGSEVDWIIDGNFVSQVNPINTVINSGSTVIKVHDTEAAGSRVGDVGPSGVWLTNPQNSLRNNIFMGCGVGIWNSFSDQCFGFSRDVALNPFLTFPTQHYNNEVGCVRSKCMSTGPFVSDEAGNLTSDPVSGHSKWGNADNDGNTLNATPERLIEHVNFWKSDNGWYGNEAVQPRYKNWTCAGLAGLNVTFKSESYGIFGNTWGGLFDGCSFFPKTLDDFYSTTHPTVMISYGNSLHRANCVFVGTPMTGIFRRGSAGDVIATSNGGPMTVEDFYVFPIYYETTGFWLDTFPGTVRDTDHNNSFIGANPGLIGIRMPPTFLFAQFGSSYTDIFDPVAEFAGVRGQAGAFRLPDDGSMFGQAGWWTYDSPFMLYGTSGAIDAESLSGYSGMNGKLLPLLDQNHFNGVQMLRASGTVVCSSEGGQRSNILDNPAISYTRIQTDFATPVTNGTWNTPLTGGEGYPYPNMRHAVVPNGGIVKVDWNPSDVPAPSSYHFTVFGSGMGQDAPAGNHIYLNLPWDHTTTITHACHMLTFGDAPNNHTIAPSASFAAWKTSTASEYWVDTVNNRVYMHLILGDLAGYNVGVYFNEP